MFFVVAFSRRHLDPPGPRTRPCSKRTDGAPLFFRPNPTRFGLFFFLLFFLMRVTKKNPVWAQKTNLFGRWYFLSAPPRDHQVGFAQLGGRLSDEVGEQGSVTLRVGGHAGRRAASRGDDAGQGSAICGPRVGEASNAVGSQTIGRGRGRKKRFNTKTIHFTHRFQCPRFLSRGCTPPALPPSSTRGEYACTVQQPQHGGRGGAHAAAQRPTASLDSAAFRPPTGDVAHRRGVVRWSCCLGAGGAAAGGEMR